MNVCHALKQTERREQIQERGPAAVGASLTSVCKCALYIGRHPFIISEDIMTRPENVAHLVQSVSGLCVGEAAEAMCKNREMKQRAGPASYSKAVRRIRLTANIEECKRKEENRPKQDHGERTSLQLTGKSCQKRTEKDAAAIKVANNDFGNGNCRKVVI